MSFSDFTGRRWYTEEEENEIMRAKGCPVDSDLWEDMADDRFCDFDSDEEEEREDIVEDIHHLFEE